MAHSLNDAVLKFLLIVADWQTDQPRLVWSWPHRVWRITPSQSVWSANILRRKHSMEIINSVLVFSHTGYSCITVVCEYRNWKKPKPSTWDWKPNQIEPKLKNPNRPSPMPRSSVSLVLGFSVSVSSRVTLVWLVSGSSFDGLCVAICWIN